MFFLIPMQIGLLLGTLLLRAKCYNGPQTLTTICLPSSIDSLLKPHCLIHSLALFIFIMLGSCRKGKLRYFVPFWLCFPKVWGGRRKPNVHPASNTLCSVLYVIQLCLISWWPVWEEGTETRHEFPLPYHNKGSVALITCSPGHVCRLFSYTEAGT